MKNKLTYLALSSLFFTACKKKTDETGPLPPISEKPEIVEVRVSSTAINQFDDLVFSIDYIDGDGDLGTEDADTKSIFIIDNRDNSIVHEFHLYPLLPVTETASIQGTLNVNLENVILLDQNNTSETASFSIYLKDRSNKQSNIVNSGSITVIK